MATRTRIPAGRGGLSRQPLPAPAASGPVGPAGAVAEPGLASTDDGPATPPVYEARDVRPRRGLPWDGAMLAVCVYLLVAVGQINALVPIIRILRPGIMAAALSLLIVTIDTSRARSFQWLSDTTSRAVLLIVTWSVVTIPAALFPGVAAKAFMDGFSKVCALYVVLVLAVRGLPDVRRLSMTFAWGGVAYCLYVVAMGRMTAAGDRVTGFSTSGYDPNDYAAYAVACVPFMLLLLGRRESPWRRVSAVGGLGVLMMGIVLSGSRGGFVALIAAVLAMLWRFDALSRAWRFGGVALGAAVIVAFANDAWWDRMATLLAPSKDYNATEDVGRTKTWLRGLGYFAQRPITGVGAENFSVAEGTLNPLLARERYGIGVQRLAPHNSYLQMITELGLPGIVLFLTAITTSFVALRDGMRRLAPLDPMARPLGHALVASLVGMYVSAFFLSHAYSAMVYASFALAVGFRKAAILTERAAR